MDGGKREPPNVPAIVFAESRRITADQPGASKWAQLVYVLEGFVSVATASARYAAPPHHAVFIPRGVGYALSSRRSCELLRLYANPAVELQLTQPTVLVGSRLVEELLGAACAAGDDYPESGPDARLARVLLDRIGTLEVRPFSLPTVRSPALAPFMDALIANPWKRARPEVLAAQLRMNAKEAIRWLEEETGMSFSRWRHRLRMLHALERLADGETITLVATELGHSSLGAFTSAFKRALGVSPMKYANRVKRSA